MEGALDCEDAAEVIASVLPRSVTPPLPRKQSKFAPDANKATSASAPTLTITARISEALRDVPSDETTRSTRRTSPNVGGVFRSQQVYASTSTSDFEGIHAARIATEEERRARRRELRNRTYMYNVQLKELTRKRNLEACLELLAEMRSRRVRADAYTYSTVLTCCSRLRATETALELYGRMLVDRVRVDEHVLVTMMGIAARANPPCLDMLRALFHQSSAPNLIMCNVYLDGLANAGMANDVEGVLRYMALRGLETDAYTGTAVAKAYVRSGRMKDAEKRVAELMKTSRQVNAGPLNVVMAAYSSIGDVKSARRVFDKLGHLRSLVSYNVLIAAYIPSANMQGAFDVFDLMLHHGHVGDRYTMHSLMKVCIAAGDGAVAFHTYTTFRDSTRWMPNNVSYRTAAHAAALSRDPCVVAEVAEDARKYGCVLREDAVAMLVGAALRSSSDDDAITYTIEYLGRSSERDSFFNAVQAALESLPSPVLEEDPGLDAREVVGNLIRACNILHGMGN